MQPTIVLHVEANSYEELLAKVDAALSGPVAHREAAPAADVEVPVNNEIITLKPGEEREPEVGRIYRHAQLIERDGKPVLVYKAPDASPLPTDPAPVAVTNAAIALAGESAPTEQAAGTPTGAASLPAPEPHTPRKRRTRQAAAAQPSAEGAVTPASAAAPQATVDNGASAAPVAPPAVSVIAAPAATPVAAVPSLDDVRTALKGVTDHEKLGYPVAVKLLADFGYERISTLPEDKRGALIVECKNAVVRASVAA